MLVEIITVIVAATLTAGLSWTIVGRTYERKISSYSKVISKMGKENRDLRQQIAEAQKTIRSLKNNPRVKELEKHLRALVNERQQLINRVYSLRNEIVSNFENHAHIQKILAELEQIAPAVKTVDKQNENDSIDIFRRMRKGMGA